MLKRVLGSIGALSFASLAALLLGCPPPPPPPKPPEPPAPTVKTCKSNGDCPGGQMCAFSEGCGPGACEPEHPCAMDLVPYCGCDGMVFKGSSNCTTLPFRRKGSCAEPAVPAPAPAAPGSKKACLSNNDCPQGEQCQGTDGCLAPWTCGPPKPCTKDLVEYCGCDGKSFKGSGTCPGKPVRRKGKC